MEHYGLEPRVVLTLPLLLSWDVEKMSASKGNYIGLTEAPEEQFGKTMSIPDALLSDWYRLLWEREAPGDVEPMEAKLALAQFLVARSHGQAGARQAEEHFTRVVRRGDVPKDLPDVTLPEGDPVHLPALLVAWFSVPSTSEARRLLAQGGVKVDGSVVSDLDVPRAELAGAVLQVGKRRFARLTVP